MLKMLISLDSQLPDQQFRLLSASNSVIKNSPVRTFWGKILPRSQDDVFLAGQLILDATDDDIQVV